MAAKKKPVPRAGGKARGRPGELESRQCATLAQHLIRRGANATTAIYTAIEILQKQSAQYAPLSYGRVRKMLTRLHVSEQWVLSSTGLKQLAEAGLSNKYGASESARAAVRAQELVLASTAALAAEYDRFLATNPSAEQRSAWLIEHEARVSGRTPPR